MLIALPSCAFAAGYNCGADEQLVVDALEKACEFLPSGAERLCDDVAVLAVNFTRLLLGQNETSVEVCNDLNFW